MRQLRRQADVELAERYRARGRSDPERIPAGSEAVARELDDLNANYQRLMDMLYERLRRIAAANPGDIVTLVSGFCCLFSCLGSHLFEDVTFQFNRFFFQNNGPYVRFEKNGDLISVVLSIMINLGFYIKAIFKYT